MNLGLGNPFSSSGTIDRGPYAVWGIILFVVKYNLDRIVAATFFNRQWGLLNYLSPSEQFRVDSIPRDQLAFYGTLLALALPFIWVGVAMTIRRLRSADLPLWLVILFFVPVVNLFFFIILSLIPSRIDDSYRRLPSRMGFREPARLDHTGPPGRQRRRRVAGNYTACRRRDAVERKRI